ncbi:MAG: AI-2E family transporter [Sphingobacteriia bacterium]|jgi:predicted PurR-regulated permease PerM|nr:AI-2E family transporter [Sphingobacteriia bacterium]
MDSLRKPFTLDRVVRLALWIAALVATYFLVRELSGVLLPFLVGWLIAYMLYPLVRFVQDKLKLRNRVLSIVVVLIVVAAVLTGLVCLLMPMISEEISKMSLLVSKYLTNTSYKSLLPAEWVTFLRSSLADINFNDLISWQNIEDAAEKLMPQVWNVLSETWSFIVGLFVVVVIFLYMIFILIDYEKVSSGFVRMVPQVHRKLVKEILSDLETGMNRYFRGQALVASIVGVLFAIGFSIIGLPLAIGCGLFIGLLNMVPYLQTVGFIPVILLALLKCAETGANVWWMLLAVFIVFIIVQGFQDMFLVPKIMGKAMGLNPAVILLSLSVWGALLGFMGLIIALPLTTLLISYYKRFVLHET